MLTHDKYMKASIVSVVSIGASQLLFATPASAQLVSCGDAANPCDFCDFVLTVDNIIGFIVGMSITLFILVMAYAGFSLITSAGDRSKLDRAKKFLTNGIVGIIIIMAGWFIVDTVLKLATGDEIGVWNSFEGNCGGERAAGAAPEFDVESGNESYAVAFADVGEEESYPEPEQLEEIYRGIEDGSAIEDGIVSYGESPPAQLGSGKVGIVEYAQQMMQKNCQYSQAKRNGCSGTPGYTDCSNLVKIAYQAAGCRAPGTYTGDMAPRARRFNSPGELRAGDALIHRTNGKGHIVICMTNGCSQVIHAKGRNYGIVTDPGSKYYNNPLYQVAGAIRAAEFCN